MKIWFPAVQTGSGADVFTRRLAEGLRAAGHQAVVTWFPHPLELYPSLLRAARMPQGTDLVHANSWNAFAFKRRGVPLLATVHHCVHDPQYAPYRSALQAIYHKAWIGPFERHGFQVANCVTTVSRYTQSAVRQCFPGVDPLVIPNGIETDRYAPYSEPGFKPNSEIWDSQGNPAPFRLFFAGNATRRKGFDLLPRILDQLGEHYSLSFTGGLRDTGASPHRRMRALGKLDTQALIHCYRHYDALLFPSRYEGFGYVPVEAMASGCAVIVSDAGALPEIVTADQTGLVCPVDDVGAFAAAVQKLAGDHILKTTLETAARQEVERRFSLTTMVDQYLDLYRELCAKPAN